MSKLKFKVGDRIIPIKSEHMDKLGWTKDGKRHIYELIPTKQGYTSEYHLYDITKDERHCHYNKGHIEENFMLDKVYETEIYQALLEADIEE